MLDNDKIPQNLFELREWHEKRMVDWKEMKPLDRKMIKLHETASRLLGDALGITKVI